MIRKVVHVIGGVGVVVLVGGCPLLDVQVETKEVCLHYADLEVPAADGSGVAHVPFVFEDFGSLQGIAQLDGQVAFERVDVTAKSGVTDFAFLTAAKVTVAGGEPDSTLPVQTVVDCSGDGCEHDGAVLSVPASTPVDAFAYVRSGSVAITLDVSGQLPTHTWTVDVDVCMSGSVSYQQQL